MKELLITFGILVLLCLLLWSTTEPVAEPVAEPRIHESPSSDWQPVGIREDEFGRATVVYEKRGTKQQFSWEQK